MSRQNRRRSILYGGASVILFVLLFLATYRGRSEGIARLEAQIVTFGDSVFGETRDETAVPARLQELLGKSVYNAAMGGTCMGRTGDDRRMDYAKGSLSMAGLAKAVLAQDLCEEQHADVIVRGVDPLAVHDRTEERTAGVDLPGE